MLDFKTRRKLTYSVAYTILKHWKDIDFSVLENKDVLSYRYLACNVAILQKDYVERKQEKEKNGNL